VYYLEPQYQQPNESPIDFAARVKAMIAERACLKNVDFDGYLKHFKPSQRYVEESSCCFWLKSFPRCCADTEFLLIRTKTLCAKLA
jgi:hypothetical protein